MSLPTAAELTDPNATNTQMKQRLGQLAENVEHKGEAINAYLGDLSSSFMNKTRLDTTGAEIADQNYLSTGFIKVNQGDVINLKTVAGTTKPPVICFYDTNKNYVRSITNTNAGALEDKTTTATENGFIRCATRIADISQRELKIIPAEKTILNKNENIQEIRDSEGVLIAYIDAAGELYIPNLGGKSIQDTIQILQDTVSKIKGSAQSVLSIVTDTAPALRKITDTQNAILEFTDETFGDLYLPGMNNQSVQEHFALLSERINGMYKSGAIFDAKNDFGIKPNGMSPRETAYRIQLAVNYISKLPDGGTLVFRPGAYLTSAAIRSESKVIFKFMRGARIVPMGAVAGFTREPTGSDVELDYLNDAAFIDVAVDGSEQYFNTEYSSSIKGFYIGGFNRCLWLRNHIHHTGATGLGVDFAKDSFILDSIAEGCGRLAEVGQAGASGIGIGTGILQDESLIISGNICKNNKNFGIFTEWQRKDFSMTRSRNTVITGNICTGNYHGLGDCGVDGLIAVGNQFNDNVSDGMILDTGTLGVSANRPQSGSGGLIASNQILRNGGNGVYYDSRNVQVDGQYSWVDNNIKNNGKAGVRIEAGNKTLTDMSIAGGSIHDNVEEAVKVVSGTLNNFDIESVKMHRNGGASSILIDATVNTGSITDCKIRPNSIAKAIKGAGKLKDMWINGNQYKGSSADPVELTHSENTITYGSNAGLGV